MELGHPVKSSQADSLAERESGKAPGVLVIHTGRQDGEPDSHERGAQREVARRLAAIKGYDFAGDFDPSYRYDGPLYFVPSSTLIGIDSAHKLGIYGNQDLFGGVVPFPFTATKVITHALFQANSHAPHGWSAGFGRQVRESVLPGFSVFSRADAHAAGAALLTHGAVRIKDPCGVGGLGQSVVHDAKELNAKIQSFDGKLMARDGLVLEQNLSKVTTCSVGRVRVKDLLITYCGTQRLTKNNNGEDVYGGSDLIVARGDFDALLRLELSQAMQTAIAQSRTYHAAAMASFAGMFASRCNYDIAQGFDDEGNWRSGVLEQSWRIGGASGAEIVALEAFQANPSLKAVCASTTEIYGMNPPLPTDAMVYFQGVDARVGPIAKYAQLTPYDNA